MKTIYRSRWLHPLLLLLLTAIGTSLRLMNLAAKPPWTDEFSTLVFSLGNSFLNVPLNQAISVDTLLQPLQPHSTAGVKEVLQHLLTESNHPPLYFVLTHWWLQLWSTDSFGLVSIWAARSLSALFGAASIPAIYLVSWLAFRSRLIGQLAAAMMAVSPYGIFLAQEARHYTLAILWVIASLGCLAIATHHIQKRTPLPILVVTGWIGVNFLGIATHYFFVLTLGAEAMVLVALAWSKSRTLAKENSHRRFFPIQHPWKQIYLVALATLLGSLVWLPVFLQNSYGSDLTQWIESSDRFGLAWIYPIFQALAAWITMLYLLPVEASALPVVIVSGLLMSLLVLWTVPILLRGFRTKLQQPTTRLITQVFAGTVGSAIIIFFCFTYFLGIDLTRGARYNFVYFPAVIVLLGASLAVCWRTPAKAAFQGKKSVAIIWLMGLVSALTVVSNLGYQKYYHPDLFVKLIQNVSQAPILIATTHKTHVQIGEMMGIARELKRGNTSLNAQFLLVEQEQDSKTATQVLSQTLDQLPRPLDVWLVNFYAPIKLNNCIADSRSLPAVDGYNYRLYHCKQ